MSLLPGTRLGVYEVTAQIGEGGMGQVYRATDTKLKRQVAIKILPSSLAADPDRLARFQREAEVLASLNHPNIAAIHGLEESDGLTALVMELVEGEDLSALIASGQPEAESDSSRLRDSASAARRGGGAPRNLSIDDTLKIARQIAEALEAAHEQGVIHRDLKPANVKVRADGTVKVLDFGLAKAMEPTSAHGASPGLSMSPTLTGRATEMGMIIGTAAYMAPEQAKGRAVDKRADIWAFGVVLYEMLTGRRAFEGEDVSETLASVLKDTPSMDALPPATPPRLTRLIARCLDRDLKTRLRDIGEARIEIARIEAGTPDGAATPVAAPVTSRSKWARALPWTVAAMALGTALVLLLLWAPWRTMPAPAPLKLLASIGASASLNGETGAAAILSPDGTMLAFVAQQAAQVQLFVRKLDQLQATPLAGTEGAASPFFSPDGQWIAFFAGSQLKKVSVTGGTALKLCDAPGGRGGAWTDDDTIIFTPDGTGPNSTLKRVPAAGGEPAAFGTLGPGAVTERWPQALPGGTALLYTEHSQGGNFDGANLVVAPLSGGPPKIVVRGGYFGRYVPGASASVSGLGPPKRDQREGGGHLIYMNQGTLFAVRFDLDRLETVGPAVPAIEGIVTNQVGYGGAQFALSSDGTLVYVPGGPAAAGDSTDWLTRDGKTSALRSAKAVWGNPRFSPDGQKLAIDILDSKQPDIWVYEWARDTLTQLTFDPGLDRNPVWTPDGRRIVFRSDRAKPGGPNNLYWVNADGTGEVTRLTDSPDSQTPFSWDPSGKFLAFSAARGTASGDLMILPMEGDAVRGWTPGRPTVFLSTPAAEGAPMFSPDGRWIAYQSNEAGGSNRDIFVRPFPGPGGKWRISTAGGAYPRWSVSTPELVFVNPYDPAPSKIMAVPYAVAGDAFRPDTPQIWSPASVAGVSAANTAYDLHRDGKRVAATVASNQTNVVQDHVVFVFNFAEYLSKIAPGTK